MSDINLVLDSLVKKNRLIVPVILQEVAFNRLSVTQQK